MKLTFQTVKRIKAFDAKEYTPYMYEGLSIIVRFSPCEYHFQDEIGDRLSFIRLEDFTSLILDREEILQEALSVVLRFDE